MKNEESKAGSGAAPARAARALAKPEPRASGIALPQAHPTSKLAPRSFLAHSFSMLPDEQPSPEQVEIMRAIPGEQRLRLAERLYWSARKMKAAGLRAQHPDWPEERVSAEVRRIFLDART